MRIFLLIGPDGLTASRFRSILSAQAPELIKRRIYTPTWSHLRLYHASADDDQNSQISARRGFDTAQSRSVLRQELVRELTKEIKQCQPDTVIFSVEQMGNLLHRPTELSRLHGLLAPFSDDIRIVIHLDEQARTLAKLYPAQVAEGRRHDLNAELSLCEEDNWWDGALSLRQPNMPEFGVFANIQHPAFWFDYERLLTVWGSTFGDDNLSVLPAGGNAILSKTAGKTLSDHIGIDLGLDAVKPGRTPPPLSAASVTRLRQFNDVLIRLLQKKDLHCPHAFWRQMAGELTIDGPPIDPGTLSKVSDHFAPANERLVARYPDLAETLSPPARSTDWVEPDPTRGFRPTQYLRAFSPQIARNCVPLKKMRRDQRILEQSATKFRELLHNKDASADQQQANAQLLDRICVNHRAVSNSIIRPHNRLTALDETAQTPAYQPDLTRQPPAGSTGNVVIACMKNEAPYVAEWIAYHRVIGVDHFVIYTNDCTDGTNEILDRLQQMGVVTHCDNNNWKGNSPQQHALKQAVKLPAVKQADWIIHIDVDEFINIRTGNGTLEDLLEAVPDATNIAMTWRLFGHNGVTDLNDSFVIDQFDSCAPQYCPKPHTAWGFKSMTKNNKAYEKIGGHRPNKLLEQHRDKVKWVNGSGKDITAHVADRGWRSSRSTIGYDLVQLNHYALRSAKSFLIKRQRGRALHVDRSVGLNYWIRMDWCDHHDMTIKRNLPRLQEEYDRLMSDNALRHAHQAGLQWHQEKATELLNNPEFNALYRRVQNIKLNATERVAYALALNMEE